MKRLLKKLIPEGLKNYYHVFLSRYASLRYGFPEKKLKLIGVTGTSGKSTTANMIFHILRENGYKVGVISTVGAIAGDKLLDTGLHVTSPDPIDFKKLLKFMVQRDIEYVIVETSSHALAQKRYGKTNFIHSVITNIKSDHLDWHKTWQNYAKAKASIALMTDEKGKIVINRDDKQMYDFVTDYLKEKKDRTTVVSFSYKELQGIEETSSGVKFMLSNKLFTVPVLGLYNVENALAAVNLCLLLGLSSDQIATGISSFSGLVGRMQVMHHKPLVIVDYAHNTDSLAKSIIAVKKLLKSGGKVICVFGSAGLRDVEKRYTMGETSAEQADITVITSEDPRIEKLYDINSQIIEGAAKKGGVLVKRFENTESYKAFIDQIKTMRADIKPKSVFAFDEETVDSRYDAVEFAIAIANEGDIVITEGKGHEASLCFGTAEYPFTDQDAVRRALGNLGHVSANAA